MVDRIWSRAAAGCNDSCSVVVQGAAIRSLPVLLGGGLLTWAKATAPAGVSDGDAHACRLPPWRHRCHGDFPFEVPGETHVPGLSGTADGGAFRVAFLPEGISLVDCVVAAHCGLVGGGGAAGFCWCARRSDPGVDSAP